MKKYLITALLALGTAALFVACGSSGGGSSTPTSCYNYSSGYNVNSYNSGTCATSVGSCPVNFQNTGNMCCPVGATSQVQCQPLVNNGINNFGGGSYYGGGYSAPYISNPYPQNYYYVNPMPYYGPSYYGQPYYGNQGSISIGLNLPF